MPIATRSPGYVVTAANWNELVAAINAAVPKLQETVTTLDGNGSIVLTTAATHVVLNGVGAADVNGMTVPERTPWDIAIVNTTSNTATLKHEDATEPTPAKRFRLPGDTDLALGLGQGVLLTYISVPAGARWVAIVSA